MSADRQCSAVVATRYFRENLGFYMTFYGRAMFFVA
jgi:hypothetical protein